MDNSDYRPTFVCFELWVGLGFFFFLPVSFSSDIFNSDQLSPLGREKVEQGIFILRGVWVFASILR